VFHQSSPCHAFELSRFFVKSITGRCEPRFDNLDAFVNLRLGRVWATGFAPGRCQVFAAETSLTQLCCALIDARSAEILLFFNPIPSPSKHAGGQTETSLAASVV